MLGGRLATARERNGMRQVDLAAALGDRYNQSMVSLAEAGKRGLRFEGAAKAAEVLRVSLDWLGGLVDDPTPVDILLAELGAYRDTRGEGPTPLNPGRLHVSLAAAERVLQRANRTMDPAEKADFVVMIYSLDAAGAVNAEAALGMLPDPKERGPR